MKLMKLMRLEHTHRHTHSYIKTHKAKCSPIKTGRGTRCESLSVALQRWRRAERHPQKAAELQSETKVERAREQPD